MVRSVAVRSGPAIGPDRSSLVIGTYEPGPSTTGVIHGTGLTPQFGNVTLNTPGATFENIDLFGRVTVSAANVTMRNCRVRGNSTVPSDGSSLINATSAACSNLLVEDCSITPDFPHWNWDSAVAGHDYTLRRCDIWGTTDGLNVYNTNAVNPYNSNVVIEGNYIHDLGWWTGATTNVVHPSDTETHNDCIQQMGGRGTIIRGNSLRAYFARNYGHWRVVGDPRVEPYTTVALNSLADGGPFQAIPDRASGTEATGRYNWDDLAAIMVNNNVGDSNDIVITDNWMYGGNYTLNAGGVAQSGALNFGTVLRNKFSRDQGAQSSGGNNTITIQLGSGWTGWVTSGVGTPDANRYFDGAEVNFRISA